ncbi:putative apses transcription factor xbp1 [Erysiphe neolycopersici]|uniref:Putative apses transcription factor xbp1 n=1 Tax=Erysiphe neolycopersici TaxID=212602 RepID=A0A420I8B5_9PEZI|nr:putative apses transcription factor xbp1 [Erysiphe neolycopersici]
MLSVASLLNPVKSEQNEMSSLPSKSSSRVRKSSPSKLPTTTKKQVPKKYEMLIPKPTFYGDIRYPPFEELDEQIMDDIRRFQVNSLGMIKDQSRHIPYNSGKNNFLEKTGRESFEVFYYDSRIPDEHKDYTVMWDYNIGLVRITPFFKCCNYTKTTPAKMLAQNPGLRDITHSITGGELTAQGYWMPFSCARDLCATFCHHIAPALIPIFGPSFPSICVHPKTPEYGRMIISPKTISEAAIQAKSSCSFILAAKAKISTYPTCHNHHLPKERNSTHASENNRFFDKQHSGSGQAVEDAKSFPPRLFSVAKPLAKNLCSREIVNSILNVDRTDSSHYSSLKRSYSFLTDISNLQIMPDFSARESIDMKENRATKRKTYIETYPGEACDLKIGTKACLAENERSTLFTSAQIIESNSGINNRSEEAKAAHSLINLRLKNWNADYEEAGNGSETHANRRRATLS